MDKNFNPYRIDEDKKEARQKKTSKKLVFDQIKEFEATLLAITDVQKSIRELIQGRRNKNPTVARIDRHLMLEYRQLDVFRKEVENRMIGLKRELHRDMPQVRRDTEEFSNDLEMMG